MIFGLRFVTSALCFSHICEDEFSTDAIAMINYHRTMLKAVKARALVYSLAALVGATCFAGARSQSATNFTLYGDVKVDESKVSGLQPATFEIILQSERLTTIGRQSVPKNGRYRFENLAAGTYYLVVLVETTQITSIRVRLSGAVGTDFRQDIALEWRPDSPIAKNKAGVIDATRYKRSSSNESLFAKSREAVNRKEYEHAKSLLQEIVNTDRHDFEAWIELGTVEFAQKHYTDAEKCYLTALEERPDSLLAMLDLGKLRLIQNNYSAAIETLSKAVKLTPPSAEANYFLGEAYLGTGKGSRAIFYMNEALRVEPIAKAEIHLRIAAIYENVGLKDLAAAEYEQFLKKRPDYPERKKLEKYIAANKKP